MASHDMDNISIVAAVLTVGRLLATHSSKMNNLWAEPDGIIRLFQETETTLRGRWKPNPDQ
jgi:hypothetical protein